MKDYRLSEIVAHCIEHQTLCDGVVYYDCENCEHNEICHTAKWGSVIGNTIEPRDMIELPYKEPSLVPDIEYFDVFYRDTQGKVARKTYARESEADAFLAKLKGDKE